jgi:lipopolysaccharide export system protein LptC
VRLPTTRLFPLGLMLVLAALTFYLDRAVNEDDSHPAMRRHDPDYLVMNFTTTTYNGAGAAESALSAERMEHYPDDDTTELTAPRVVQTRPAAPKITVRADRGKLSRDGEDIYLYDNVVLEREAGAGQTAARLETEYLQVVRDRSLVRTDREVRIIEETRSLSGKGMEYSSETQHFTLNADVRARFEPRTDPRSSPQ